MRLTGTPKLFPLMGASNFKLSLGTNDDRDEKTLSCLESLSECEG